MGIDDYTNLIPTENSRMPKFMSFLEAVLAPAVDLQAVVQNSDAFDVNNAVGDQLDTIGEVVCTSRKLPYYDEYGSNMMSDDVFNIIIRMRIAQEMWDGTNDMAPKLYKDVLSDKINISYIDNVDGSLTFKIGSESASVAQAIYASDELLVPAGVGVTMEQDVYTQDINSVAGIAVIGEEYVNVINLERGNE